MKTLFSLIFLSFLLLCGGLLPAQSPGMPAEAQAAVPIPGQQWSPRTEGTVDAKKAEKKHRRKHRRGRRGGFSLNIFAGKAKKVTELPPEVKLADVRAMLTLAKIYGLLWSLGLLLWPGLVAGFLLSPVLLLMTWIVPWKEFTDVLPGLQEVIDIGRIHAFILFGFNLVFLMTIFLFIEFSPAMILLVAMMVLASFILSILLTIRATDALRDLNWGPEEGEAGLEESPNPN